MGLLCLQGKHTMHKRMAEDLDDSKESFHMSKKAKISEVSHATYTLLVLMFPPMIWAFIMHSRLIPLDPLNSRTFTLPRPNWDSDCKVGSPGMCHLQTESWFCLFDAAPMQACFPLQVYQEVVRQKINMPTLPPEGPICS